MTGYGFVAFLLVLAALALGVAWVGQQQGDRRRIERRLTVRGDSTADARVLKMRFADLFDDQEAIRRHLARDSELALAMWQAGYRSPLQRASLYGIQVLLPIVVLIVAGVWMLFDGFTQMTLLGALAIVIISVLAPKRVLQARARVRLKQIDNELSLFVQMMRILFDSGLAVEQALRVMVREGRSVLPTLMDELEPVLRRAEQGLDLADELQRAALQLQHNDFTDVTVIIRQMLKQGGSARSSLSKLIELIDQRQLSLLQEKVSKLSAKMTVVMIIFFFPALLILLAGPGFISIGDSMVDF